MCFHKTKNADLLIILNSGDNTRLQVGACQLASLPLLRSCVHVFHQLRKLVVKLGGKVSNAEGVVVVTVDLLLLHRIKLCPPQCHLNHHLLLIVRHWCVE